MEEIISCITGGMAVGLFFVSIPLFTIWAINKSYKDIEKERKKRNDI